MTSVAWAWIPAERLEALARDIGSNGCTGVLQLRQGCCIAHDWAYAYHRDPATGEPLTRSEADRRFRACLQTRSRLGIWSPLAFWRWAGVRMFGSRSWTEPR